MPVFSCIYFKILFIISESVSNRSCSMYSLRLHCFNVLDRPKDCMPATLGTRLFSTAAPTLKNNLPAHIHDIESLGTFKRHVKTFFFYISFYIVLKYFLFYFHFINCFFMSIFTVFLSVLFIIDSFYKFLKLVCRQCKPLLIIF